MPRRFLFHIGALSLLLGLLGARVPVHAQQPSDSLRRAALKDYHGPDLEGKDGPLAKAGLDLLLLYHEYRAVRRGGGDTFAPSQSGLRVSDGYVTIDAIAASDADQLRSALTSLGLKEAATAGRVVSGAFPIRRIPALAKLESLRGVMPSRARTRDANQGVSPPRPPSSPTADPSVRPEPSPAPSAPPTGTGGGILGFFLAVLLVLLLLEP